MSLVEKMSAQEKIAQLESRIVYLEDQVEKIRNLKVITTTTTTDSFYARVDEEGIFGAHWNRMWAEFDLVMKKAFGR
jgi:hypothetical protein